VGLSNLEVSLWSHMGWLLKTEASLIDHANVQDLRDQWFYRYVLHECCKHMT
jgi:fatty-acid desaturase